MIKLRVNSEEPYVAAYAGKGDGWEYVRVKGSGGDRKTITIWADNAPTRIKEGDAFRITEISGIRYNSRKDSKGEWRDEFHLNAKLEKVGGMPSDVKPKTRTMGNSKPEWTPPPREEKEPTFYDIMTGVDRDDGLPF